MAFPTTATLATDLMLTAATGAVTSAGAAAAIGGASLLAALGFISAAFDRRRLESQEAGLKYFVLGAFSSAVFLYGVALTYGATGSTNLTKIVTFLFDTGVGDKNGLLLLGFALLLVGFGFKIAAVPFHMWTPDVYEGAPTPITAFFSASPKLAAMALFVRAMIEALPGAIDQWQQIVIFISILSMALGAFVAGMLISETQYKHQVEEDIKRHFAQQKQENARYQQQITAFRGEKTALDMQMLELERRMTTLEHSLGGSM